MDKELLDRLKRAKDNEEFYAMLAERYRLQAKAALDLAQEWREMYLQQISIQNARTLNNVLIQGLESGGSA